jgi:hypothetical protein
VNLPNCEDEDDRFGDEAPGGDPLMSSCGCRAASASANTIVAHSGKVSRQVQFRCVVFGQMACRDPRDESRSALGPSMTVENRPLPTVET